MIFDLGKIYPAYKGEWTSNTQYEVLDIVYHNGSSYIAKQDNRYENPDNNPNFWGILALRGEISGALTPQQMNDIVHTVTTQSGVVVDPSYIHTDNNFTQEQVDTLNSLGNGSLTVTVNGNTVAEIQTGAFATGHEDIDLNVPTTINDLIGVDQLYQTPDVEIKTEDIDVLESGKVYFYDGVIDNLTIKEVPWTETIEAYKYRDSEIRFTAGKEFTLNLNPKLKIIGNDRISEGSYIGVIHADTIEFKNIYTVNE